MSVFFDNHVFSAAESSTGVFALGAFTGTNLLSGVTPVSINGTIENPGSTVQMTINVSGITSAGVSGTYLGYSAVPNSQDYVYYFSVTPANLSTPVVIAVTAAPALPTLTLQPVITTNVPAPIGASPVCYASGTLIATPTGEANVEDLKVGDTILTASGEQSVIRWMGHRTIDFTRSLAKTHGQPILIEKDAFAPARPDRDLLVSPAHCICVDVLGEVLVPAGSLINGTTVRQLDVDQITYWHVELDAHDLLLANNLPAETFLANVGNRSFFASSDVVSIDAANEELGSIEGAIFCRPRIEGGPLVDVLRQRLNERALSLGWSLVEDGLETLELSVDGVVIRPETDGLTARFVVPADAREVHLLSAVTVPAHIYGVDDHRELGVAVREIMVDDGLSTRRAATLSGDDRIEGFSTYEANAETGWRWTNGRARVPEALWEGCRSQFFLRVELQSGLLPRWVKQVEARSNVYALAA